MINSRNILDLTPSMQHKTLAWLDACDKANVQVKIISTFRDAEYQNWLFAQGRTREGKIVTYAKAGQSEHNHKRAFDFCIIKAGKADWQDVASYTKAGLIAESLGLKWAGRWNGRMKELGHIQEF